MTEKKPASQLQTNTFARFLVIFEAVLDRKSIPSWKIRRQNWGSAFRVSNAHF